MTWSKRDDLCDEHPKIKALDNRAYRFWNILVNYAARHLTDGHIDDAALDYARQIMGLKRPSVDAVLAQLCRSPAGFRSGLLERNGQTYVLHDFLDYNRERAQVMKEREEARERQRKWREKQKGKSRRYKSERNAVSNASPTRPDPPLKGGGSEEPPSGLEGQGGPPPDFTPEEFEARTAAARTEVANLGVRDPRDLAYVVELYRANPTGVGDAIRASITAPDFWSTVDKTPPSKRNSKRRWA